MGTVNDKLSYLGETKNEIKNAIEEKGVNIPAYATFREYASRILDIATSQDIETKLTEIIGDIAVQGTESQLADKILEYKESMRQAIQEKNVEISQSVPLSQYASKIESISYHENISEINVNRINYKTDSKVLYAIAYQKSHNLYPDLNRLLICDRWTHGDSQVFKIGGPNNYKVELQTGKIYSSSDTSNVSTVTHNWNTLIDEDAAENDEDTDWNYGFGVATIYMDGNEYDQIIEITGGHMSPAYISLDGCSIHLNCLSGIGESAILDSTNGGKYILSSQEDIDTLKLIKPKYIKGLYIEYDNLTNLFPDSIKYLSFDTIVTTSKQIKLPYYLEELENMSVLKDAGLTPPSWSSFFYKNCFYIGNSLTFTNEETPSTYIGKASIEVAPNLIFDGNNSASSLFDSCRNLKRIQSIVFNNCNNIDLSYMFVRCYSLKCPDLFDTSLAKNMQAMFLSCYSLETIPLYDTTNVDNMSMMFADCFLLKEVPTIDMSNVTNADKMFENCRSLEKLHMVNIGVNIDISASTKFTSESLIEILSNLKADVARLLILGEENLSKLNDVQKAVATNKGWILI